MTVAPFVAVVPKLKDRHGHSIYNHNLYRLVSASYYYTVVLHRSPPQTVRLSCLSLYQPFLLPEMIRITPTPS